MPSFTATIDFEVFCSCGNGLCGLTDTRESRHRGYPQAVVDPCPKCLERARDELQSTIDELQATVDELRMTISRYEE